jgi:hypothetical protein
MVYFCSKLSLMEVILNFQLIIFKRSRSCSKEKGKITIESLPPGLVTNKIMQADTTSEGTSISEEASADKTSSEATVKNANPSSEGEYKCLNYKPHCIDM